MGLEVEANTKICHKLYWFFSICRYKDVSDYFEYDLAILRLERPFKFSVYISPICVRFTTKREHDNWMNRETGYFTAWSSIPNQSYALQRNSMTTLSRDSCNELVNRSVGYPLPTDKFCIYNQQNVTACRGDSGGGFFVQNKFIASGYWYYEYQLLGVLSNVPRSHHDCSLDTVIAMTDLHYHYQFIYREMQKDVKIY